MLGGLTANGRHRFWVSQPPKQRHIPLSWSVVHLFLLGPTLISLKPGPTLTPPGPFLHSGSLPSLLHLTLVSCFANRDLAPHVIMVLALWLSPTDSESISGITDLFHCGKQTHRGWLLPVCKRVPWITRKRYKISKTIIFSFKQHRANIIPGGREMNRVSCTVPHLTA